MRGFKISIFLQGLNICGESGDTHEALVIYLEDSLEVCVNSHQLRGETGVSSDGDTVLARHSNHHITVVIENRLKTTR